jgi:phosphohistidine phosphatase SixA
MSSAPASAGFVVTCFVAAVVGCAPPGPSVSPTAPTTGGGATAPESAHVTGLVGAVSGACPNLTFTAGNHAVATVKPTTFQPGSCADLRRGDLADVQGTVDARGVVIADRVEVVPDGPGSVGLLSDVAAGGYVLFFRHSERDAGALSISILAEVDNRGECRPGSELTATGQSDAVALGQRFQRYGIEVDKVYASPTCRTMEMARLAFGTFETTRALTYAGMWASGEDEVLAAQLRTLLSTVPRAGTNIVLIAHNDVMRTSRVGLDLTLDQAEAAVFRPRGGGTFEFLGKIPKAEWKGK